MFSNKYAKQASANKVPIKVIKITVLIWYELKKVRYFFKKTYIDIKIIKQKRWLPKELIRKTSKNTP